MAKENDLLQSNMEKPGSLTNTAVNKYEKENNQKNVIKSEKMRYKNADEIYE